LRKWKGLLPVEAFAADSGNAVYDFAPRLRRPRNQGVTSFAFGYLR
jgi:hypothetical protein